MCHWVTYRLVNACSSLALKSDGAVYEDDCEEDDIFQSFSLFVNDCFSFQCNQDFCQWLLGRDP